MQDDGFFLLGRFQSISNGRDFFLQEVEEAKRVAALQYLCLEGIGRSFSWLKLLKPHKFQQ